LEIKDIKCGFTFMTLKPNYQSSVEKPISSTSKESEEVSSYIKNMLIFLTEAFVHLEFVPPDQPVNEVRFYVFIDERFE